MSKEMWIAAFDQLVEEYQMEHPEATDDEAYAWAEKHTDAKYADNVGALIDQARDRAKYVGIK